MKTTQSFLLVLVVTLGVLFNSCDSSTSSTQPTICGDPSLHLQKICFMLNGTSYDFDSLASAGSSTMKSFDGWFDKTDFTIEFTAYSRELECIVTLKIPKYRTGVYRWENRNIDSNGYGIQINLDSTPGLRLKHRSMSGNTNIIVFDAPNDGRDSLFGTFCGTVKDNTGNILEITDGRFYSIDAE